MDNKKEIEYNNIHLQNWKKVKCLIKENIKTVYNIQNFKESTPNRTVI